MLKSGCILRGLQVEDGLRISIMSRHTLEDGVTPDPRITDGMFDFHVPDLAPSPEVVGKWYREEYGPRDLDTFNTKFAQEYLGGLAKKHSTVLQLVRLALNRDITVMCIEPELDLDESDSLLCHRRLLLAHCAMLNPRLKIDIK